MVVLGRSRSVANRSQSYPKAPETFPRVLAPATFLKRCNSR
jgi:hypothetical protein